MANLEFDDVEGGYGYGPGAAVGMGMARPSGMQRAMGLMGALTTVAVVVGVGVWGYQIAVRDAMGIPVVRALEGPMRVAPKNPGGSVADHQGLAINAIAADGAAAPLPDQLLLAPEPVALTDEDAPGLAAPVVAAPAMPADAVVDAGPQAGAAPADRDAVADALVAAMTEAPEQPEAGRSATDVLSLADMLAAGAAPLAALEGEAPAAEAVASSAAAPVVARSPRPLARPAGLQTAAVARAATDPVADAVAGALAGVVREVDPGALTKGERLVQLGAFDDPESARAEWDKLSGRFGELMAGKGRVIQSAQSGGRTFFRLRAQGFEDAADARRFCSALLAEDAACIPVSLR